MTQAPTDTDRPPTPAVSTRLTWAIRLRYRCGESVTDLLHAYRTYGVTAREIRELVRDLRH